VDIALLPLKSYQERLTLVFTEPNSYFTDRVLIAAPHMDDAVLACGGTIAQLADKERISVVYATDGSRSPVPMFPWQGPVSPDLTAIREQEARAALGILGVSDDNVHFLGLPDGRLRAHVPELSLSLAELIGQMRPEHILVPFRYDRHPDHLALHRSMTQALADTEKRVSLTEYFVYYRWQLISGKDVRKHIQPDHLVAIDIQQYASAKRHALMAYRSQTTRFFDWQDRPILPNSRLEETASGPELFLRYRPDCPGADVFAGSRLWIRLIHRVEPALKSGKDYTLALWKALLSADSRA
jgi:LmbE family N-acetylglucosaminyl deacetylase